MESDRYASRTQAEADAAAASLLAELDEEARREEGASAGGGGGGKKSKKKRRKERQQAAAAARVKEEEERLSRKREEELAMAEERRRNDMGKEVAREDGKGGAGSQQAAVALEVSEKKSKKKKKKHKLPDDRIATAAGQSGQLHLEKPASSHDAAFESNNIKRVLERTGAEEETEGSEEDEHDIMMVASMGQRAAAASSRKGSAKINKAPTGGAKIAGIGDETSEPSKSDDKDDAELELASMVADGNEDGIEHLLSELRGIPGRAALRKNAKKALKRIREERSLLSVGAAPASGEWMETSSKSSRAAKSAGSSNIMASGVGMGGSTVVSLPAPTKEVVAQKNAVSTTSTASSPTLKEESKASIQPTIYGGGSATSTAQAAVTTPSSLYKPPEPLLKFVSHTHRAPGQAPLNEDRGTYHAPASARTECVLHMAPSVVGWVIGRGGQRIRDLMEESTAKVWIDQDSMGPKEMRIVYVSGSRKAVDVAVRMIKDLVAKAPVGGGGVGQVLPAASAP